VWHWPDHTQTTCTSLQKDNHANTSSFSFTGWLTFSMPSQQFQSTALLYKTISKQLSTAAADAARKSAIVPHPTQAPTSCPQLLFLPS